MPSPRCLKRPQFKYWYAEWRNETFPVMRMGRKRGEKPFIDFTVKKLTIADREAGGPTLCVGQNDTVMRPLGHGAVLRR